MNRQHRKPDILIVLAVVVALGIVITTTVQANGSAKRDLSEFQLITGPSLIIQQDRVVAKATN